ncbi:MAG: transcription antitermination factor NusB [Parvularculales bacterium]
MTEAGQATRLAAVKLVHHVLAQRKPLDGEAFGLITRSLERRDRGHARAIALTVLRRKGQLDALLDVFIKKPLGQRQALVISILRVALAQILFLNTAPHAAVNLAVVHAAAHPRTRPWKGLVNAVLRAAVREGPELIIEQDEATLNTPDWLMASWARAYGETASRAIAQAHLEEPPLDLTVKPSSSFPVASLPEGVQLGSTLRLSRRGVVEALPGYNEGAWWVQDAAAAIAISLMGSVAGQQIFDLCAAPGGKTAQLAALGAHVTAVDVSARRLELLATNLSRLCLEAQLVMADAEQWQPDTPPKQASAVLLDAPCSATGTMRRHPDIAWLKQPDDVTTMAALQRRLLDHAATLTAPGGVLLYCVCSLQPEEGEYQAADFLSRQPQFQRHPVKITDINITGLGEVLISPQGDVRSLPCHLTDQGGMDGFFVARFRRDLVL